MKLKIIDSENWVRKSEASTLKDRITILKSDAFHKGREFDAFKEKHAELKEAHAETEAFVLEVVQANEDIFAVNQRISAILWLYKVIGVPVVLVLGAVLHWVYWL